MKALVIAISLSFCLSISAQYLGTYSPGLALSFQYEDVDRSGNTMAINYDQSDELIYGLNYKRALFPIHRGYSNLPGENLVYALYSLDSLIKSDNSYQVPFSSISGLVLDSLDIELSHVKHSAGNDTLILTLLALDTVQFPNGPVALIDTLILDSALSNGNILTNTTALRWKPNFTMNEQPIGLKIEFTGSLQDTLAILGGYGIFPAPNACTDSSWDKARKSIYYPNSYAYWSNYDLVLPTNVQGDVFYDCNGNVLKDTSDSESYIQNWAITSYVSAPEIGIGEEDLIHLTIYPNPASNIIYVRGVDNMHSVKVFSCSGACVKTFTNPSCMDIADLNNGIYIFVFEYGNKAVHKKVVVQR